MGADVPPQSTPEQTPTAAPAMIGVELSEGHHPGEKVIMPLSDTARSPGIDPAAVAAALAGAVASPDHGVAVPQPEAEQPSPSFAPAPPVEAVAPSPAPESVPVPEPVAEVPAVAEEQPPTEEVEEVEAPVAEEPPEPEPISPELAAVEAEPVAEEQTVAEEEVPELDPTETAEEPYTQDAPSPSDTNEVLPEQDEAEEAEQAAESAAKSDESEEPKTEAEVNELTFGTDNPVEAAEITDEPINTELPPPSPREEEDHWTDNHVQHAIENVDEALDNALAAKSSDVISLFDTHKDRFQDMSASEFIETADAYLRAQTEVSFFKELLDYAEKKHKDALSRLAEIDGEVREAA
jgi:hypothetical protein